MVIGIALSGLLAFAQGSTEAEAIELARTALAAETATDGSELALERVQAVQWPDRGLGCDRSKTSAPLDPLPGYRVLMSAPKGVYAVHVGAGRAIVCAGPLRRDETSVIAEPLAQEEKIQLPEIPEHRELVERAIAELASRLNVAPDLVELLEFGKVMWSDRSRGCPRPGMFYAQVLTEGYRARLRVDTKTYSYHGGLRGDLFYCEKPRPPLPDGNNSGGA